jgi:hypothetical protein
MNLLGPRLGLGVEPRTSNVFTRWLVVEMAASHKRVLATRHGGVLATRHARIRKRTHKTERDNRRES